MGSRMEGESKIKEDVIRSGVGSKIKENLMRSGGWE